MSTNNKGLKQSLNNLLNALLESGTTPISIHQRPILNALSGKVYGGLNGLSLQMEAMERGWSDHRILTTAQMRKASTHAYPAKGSKAVYVQSPHFDRDEFKGFRSKPYFSVSDIENLDADTLPAKLNLQAQSPEESINAFCELALAGDNIVEALKISEILSQHAEQGDDIEAYRRVFGMLYDYSSTADKNQRCQITMSSDGWGLRETAPDDLKRFISELEQTPEGRAYAQEYLATMIEAYHIEKELFIMSASMGLGIPYQAQTEKDFVNVVENWIKEVNEGAFVRTKILAAAASAAGQYAADLIGFSMGMDWTTDRTWLPPKSQWPVEIQEKHQAWGNQTGANEIASNVAEFQKGSATVQHQPQEHPSVEAEAPSPAEVTENPVANEIPEQAAESQVATFDFETVAPYLTEHQLQSFKEQLMTADESHQQQIINQLNQLNERVSGMPDLLEQDGKGLNATAHLRYTTDAGGFIYITERDAKGGDEAYGYADHYRDGMSGELGSIYLSEIRMNPMVHLDLDFEPCKLIERLMSEGAILDRTPDLDHYDMPPEEDLVDSDPESSKDEPAAPSFNTPKSAAARSMRGLNPFG